MPAELPDGFRNAVGDQKRVRLLSRIQLPSPQRTVLQRLVRPHECGVSPFDLDLDHAVLPAVQVDRDIDTIPRREAMLDHAFARPQIQNVWILSDEFLQTQVAFAFATSAILALQLLPGQISIRILIIDFRRQVPAAFQELFEHRPVARGFQERSQRVQKIAHLPIRQITEQ